MPQELSENQQFPFSDRDRWQGSIGRFTDGSIGLGEVIK